jgi:hypothetical protein
MFPSLGILQYYVESNICTTITLEKLLGVGSFGGFINHLICHHAIIPTSLGGFGLPYVVWTTTPTFLKCWALIVLALVTHFK